MKGVGAALLLGLCCAAPAVAAADYIPSGEAIWSHVAQPGDFSEGPFPILPRPSGRVVLDCAVTIDGHLRDCRISEESPAGVGLGKEALKLGKVFKLEPKTKSGRSVGGLRIRIPIVFRGAE